MLYYLALTLRPYVSAFNVFSYHTVRAGAAALTGFLICLLVGPFLIRWLQALNIGQHIRKEHVADLHHLHKEKAGTPTMGGALIILSSLAALLLWARPTNRLLLVAAGMLSALGALGFLDDYIKLRRKHNKGLTAKAKFGGQILAGLVLGIYLVHNPITVSAAYLSPRAAIDWPAFAAVLHARGTVEPGSAAGVFWGRLSPALRKRLANKAGSEERRFPPKALLIKELNGILGQGDVYDEGVWPAATLTREAKRLVAKGAAGIRSRDQVRLNRLLLEAAFPQIMVPGPPDLHTKVNVPGFKDLLITFGMFYVLFVIIIVVSSSNAVNITDGLDGLAIGASIMSLLAYTGIAYVVSRSDWSDYLYLTYVPEASELTVFGAALLGSGLGFLWFNAHPAEVFMGDTGSLALGGAIGTMAILTKQELLLILVGGLFVVEAASVVIQVVSNKLWGKRVFRMAPLHHHFELKGWSESKVTIRFWILALIFALLSLGTLKLR